MRRPLLLALVPALVVLGAGCADDIAPAARFGDSLEIAHDDLLAEAAEWANSPTFVQQLQIATTAGPGPGSFDMDFVDFLLTTRISFEVHNAEFDELGLELTDQQLAEARAGLFADPATTAAVLDELSPSYAERLVADAARQFAVRDALAEGYEAWQVEAFVSGDIEVNPRYGRWDGQAASVVAPTGPVAAPPVDVLLSP